MACSQSLDDEAWQRLEVRDGSKGPLVVEAVKRRVMSGPHRRQPGDEEILVVIRYRERDQQEVVKVDYDLSNAAPETPLKYPSINECRMFPYFLLQRYGVDRFEEGIMFREAKDGNGIDEAMGCGS